MAANEATGPQCATSFCAGSWWGQSSAVACLPLRGSPRDRRALRRRWERINPLSHRRQPRCVADRCRKVRKRSGSGFWSAIRPAHHGLTDRPYPTGNSPARSRADRRSRCCTGTTPPDCRGTRRTTQSVLAQRLEYCAMCSNHRLWTAGMPAWPLRQQKNTGKHDRQDDGRCNPGGLRRTCHGPKAVE